MKMRFALLHQIIVGLIFCLPMASVAAVSVWQINSDTSNLRFVATENATPISGQFKTFTGDIRFDPAKLNNSQVNITITMSSLQTTFLPVGGLLKAADWFDVDHYPQSFFKANKFHKLDKDHYVAMGSLTLRGKTAPITVKFTWASDHSTTAHTEGTALLQRSLFGVGQGDWATTEDVNDNVVVNFTLDLSKK